MLQFPRDLSLIICVVGLLIYLLVPKERTRSIRVGEIMFAIGLFVYLYGSK